MKHTFAPKTFAAWLFRCVTLSGRRVQPPFRTAAGQTAYVGRAVAGQTFSTGAVAGQSVLRFPS